MRKARLAAALVPLAGFVAVVWAPSASAGPICSPMPCVLDFETDDFGTTLINGQSISTNPDVQDNKGNPDTVFEFGNLVEISTIQIAGSHEGAAIFDSTPGGPNDPGVDEDLLVDLGNILILQADESPSTTLDATNGLVFDTPNDEADFSDRGSIVFDFLISGVQLLSIDLIDINGGAQVNLILTDGSGLTRTYDVPEDWTNDVTVAPTGFDTLLLNTLGPQLGEGGATATAFEDVGFDPTTIQQLEVQFIGAPSSAGLDNLTFVPEPSSAAMLALGLTGLVAIARRLRF